MCTYATADWHVQHEGILTMCQRPFKTIDEHDDYLLDRINSVVKQKDVLLVLGDAGWRGLEGFMRRVVCENVYLVWGNHDRAGYAKHFKSADDVSEIKLYGEIKAFLSHYPHMYWPSSHYGSLHLYGHMHSEREEYLDEIWPERRSMDVGVDNAKILLGDYVPFHIDYILERLLKRKGHDPVSWYRTRRGEKSEKAADMDRIYSYERFLELKKEADAKNKA